MDRLQRRKILSLSLISPKENSFVSKTEDTIYGCIEPPKDAVKAGKAISLPRGKFEIKLLLDQLPSNWQPDLISISSSLALSHNPPIPTGFQNSSYPSVMKLTDSHHMHRPIQRLIEYSKVVGCRYHWTTYNPQHLHFYQEAGLANVFWMPGAISISSYETKPASEKLYDIIFCGSIGSGHPYRAGLLNFLQESGINITITRRSYTESLQAYAESKIVFNCSLNGDFNRRCFEVLMAGGFLLTDRLPPESGLPLLFQEGVHLECYGSEQELLDKVKYYLAHPDQAAEIARQGHEEFMSKYHPEILREKFYDFVIKGQPIPELFLVKNDNRLTNIANISNYTETLQDRIRVYELFQEIHRINSKVSLLYYQGKNQALVSDLRDLPRLQIALANSAEEVSNHSQMFDVVMIDSSHEEDLANELKTVDKYLSDGGLLLLVGEIPSTLPAKIKPIAKQKGWQKVKLIETNSHQFMAVGFHLAYQKQSKKLPSNSDANCLVIKTDKTLGLKERLKRKLRSILP